MVRRQDGYDDPREAQEEDPENQPPGDMAEKQDREAREEGQADQKENGMNFPVTHRSLARL
jgi:hypothetical protein